jgi:CheY-like chemotaxis protein
VKNLLEVSRRQKPAKNILDINSIVSNAIGAHEYQIKNDKIKLEIELSEEDLMALGNTNQLRQVFSNIITNAMQAITDANIKNGFLRCVTKRFEHDVKISFYNNGPSIPEGFLDRVFDPFFTSSEGGEGTGLGMYVSQGIIEDHGGLISVNNSNGSGVEFHITLPISKSAEKKVEAPLNSSDIGRGLKALVVDDEVNLLTWLERTMSDIDVDVYKATNGIEAIALLDDQEFDVIFSDIKMPKMNGIEFMKWLYSNKPNYLKRLVITTGVIDDTIRDYSKVYGCEYMVKPFTEEKIFEALRKVTSPIAQRM